MVRRRNAKDIDPRAPAQGNRAVATAEKMDSSADGVIFKAHPVKVSANVRRLSGADPGPTGFDWVEIDFRHTH